jgi:hypothetical protein
MMTASDREDREHRALLDATKRNAADLGHDLGSFARRYEPLGPRHPAIAHCRHHGCDLEATISLSNADGIALRFRCQGGREIGHQCSTPGCDNAASESVRVISRDYPYRILLCADCAVWERLRAERHAAQAVAA